MTCAFLTVGILPLNAGEDIPSIVAEAMNEYQTGFFNDADWDGMGEFGSIHQALGLSPGWYDALIPNYRDRLKPLRYDWIDNKGSGLSIVCDGVAIENMLVFSATMVTYDDTYMGFLKRSGESLDKLRDWDLKGKWRNVVSTRANITKINVDEHLCVLLIATKGSQKGTCVAIGRAPLFDYSYPVTIPDNAFVDKYEMELFLQRQHVTMRRLQEESRWKKKEKQVLPSHQDSHEKRP
ncbi:hypothetical protein LBMAG53_26980 [Planctomycetota bacterium]|nr:hypothetical protein LBMAG53_26980 [Planctomycetota bacterium]